MGGTGARRVAGVAGLLLALLTSGGCAADDPEPAPVSRTDAAAGTDGPDGAGGAGGTGAELERLAAEPAVDLLASVGRVLDAVVVAVSDPDVTYTYDRGRDAWQARVAVPVPTATGVGVDRPGTLLRVGRVLCLDRAARPLVATLLEPSYGRARFDRAPWTCSRVGFGLNEALLWGHRREDPLSRVAGLDPGAGAYDATVDELDGVPAVHVRTSGPGAAGALEPARPTYDLWIGADRRPLRLHGDGRTWTFDYGDPAPRLPARADRGAYGYVLGPGQSAVKACFYGQVCPPLPPLTWSDARTAG